MFLGQSTGNMGIITYEEQLRVIEILTKLNYEGTIAVHAEKESLMHPEKYIDDHFETHSLARPQEAEIESVRDILNIQRVTGFKGNIHIAHISTMGAIELVKSAKLTQRVTMGVTAHHALFTIDDAKDHDRYLKMNPPLRDEKNRKAVFESLLDGTADWIESDHAPHTLQQKEAGASGIRGFNNILILIDALKKAGIS